MKTLHLNQHQLELFGRFAWLASIEARRFARRLPPGADVDDLAQVALIALVQAVQARKPSRGNFTTFAGRCMKNQMASAFEQGQVTGQRQRGAHPVRTVSLFAPSGDSTLIDRLANPKSPRPGDEPDAPLAFPVVDAATAALPPRQLQAVALMHGQDRFGSEAAQAMGISRAAAQTQARRGMRTLRAFMGIPADLRDHAPHSQAGRYEIEAHAGPGKGWRTIGSWEARSAMAALRRAQEQHSNLILRPASLWSLEAHRLIDKGRVVRAA